MAKKRRKKTVARAVAGQEAPAAPRARADGSGLGMTLEDVCQIIRVAAASNVNSLRIGGLQVSFKQSLDDSRISDPRVAPPSTLNPALRTADTARKADRAGRIGEQADLVDDELEHLKVTDPAAYEAFIQSEDADDGGDDGS
jgi:hypothetical protein